MTPACFDGFGELRIREIAGKPESAEPSVMAEVRLTKQIVDGTSEIDAKPGFRMFNLTIAPLCVDPWLNANLDFSYKPLAFG